MEERQSLGRLYVGNGNVLINMTGWGTRQSHHSKYDVSLERKKTCPTLDGNKINLCIDKYLQII